MGIGGGPPPQATQLALDAAQHILDTVQNDDASEASILSLFAQLLTSFGSNITVQEIKENLKSLAKPAGDDNHVEVIVPIALALSDVAAVKEYLKINGDDAKTGLEEFAEGLILVDILANAAHDFEGKDHQYQPLEEQTELPAVLAQEESPNGSVLTRGYDMFLSIHDGLKTIENIDAIDTTKPLVVKLIAEIENRKEIVVPEPTEPPVTEPPEISPVTVGLENLEDDIDGTSLVLSDLLNPGFTTLPQGTSDEVSKKYVGRIANEANSVVHELFTDGYFTGQLNVDTLNNDYDETITPYGDDGGLSISLNTDDANNIKMEVKTNDPTFNDFFIIQLFFSVSEAEANHTVLSNNNIAETPTSAALGAGPMSYAITLANKDLETNSRQGTNFYYRLANVPEVFGGGRNLYLLKLSNTPTPLFENIEVIN